MLGSCMDQDFTQLEDINTLCSSDQYSYFLAHYSDISVENSYPVSNNYCSQPIKIFILFAIPVLTDIGKSTRY